MLSPLRLTSGYWYTLLSQNFCACSNSPGTNKLSGGYIRNLPLPAWSLVSVGATPKPARQLPMATSPADLELAHCPVKITLISLIFFYNLWLYLCRLMITLLCHVTVEKIIPIFRNTKKSGITPYNILKYI